MRLWVTDFRSQYVFYEQPFFIPGAPGNERQDFSKLCTTAGAIAGAASAICPTYPIDVIDWKGQLPKAVMMKRIEKVLRDDDWEDVHLTDSHSADAMGIGMFLLGKL